MSRNIYKGIDDRIVKQVKFYARRLKNSRCFDATDIDDLEQELMVEIFANMHAFKPETSDLSTFASKILNHRSKNLLRNERRQKRFNPCGITCFDEKDIADHRVNIEHSNAKIDIDQCIEKLPQKFKTTCELLKIHNKTDTAKIMGTARPTISVYIKILRVVLGRLKDYVSIENQKKEK